MKSRRSYTRLARLADEDRLVIARFLQKLQSLPRLEAVVLFGSLARGDGHLDSDIDLLVVLDMGEPESLRRQMAAWITELNPHREIRPVLTNLKDVDPSFLRNVLREGVVIHGGLVVTREGLGLQPRVLLAYDLSGAAAAEKARISRMVHGYETHVGLGRTQRTYRYPGLKEGEGNALVTRSALLLRKEDAEAFAARLRARRIPFTRWDVYA